MNSTTVYDFCPYCNRSVNLDPADIIIQTDGPRSVHGTYRWFHDCNGGPIVKKANQRVLSVLIAAGCEVEYTGDEAIVDGFSRQLDLVSTPADMGFVS